MSLRHATRLANALRNAGPLFPCTFAGGLGDRRGLADGVELKKTTLYDFHVLHGGVCPHPRIARVSL
jgi:hypothetical protein